MSENMVRYCTSCGATLTQDAKFCSSCGQSVENTIARTEDSANLFRTEQGKGSMSEKKKRIILFAVIAFIFILAGWVRYMDSIGPREVIVPPEEEHSARQATDFRPCGENPTVRQHLECEKQKQIKDLNDQLDRPYQGK
jgi:hypothetical protein